MVWKICGSMRIFLISYIGLFGCTSGKIRNTPDADGGDNGSTGRCPEKWFEISDRCIWFSTKKGNQLEMLDLCSKQPDKSSMLVNITSKDINDEIFDKARSSTNFNDQKPTMYFIGLIGGTNGKFAWIGNHEDLTPTSFTRFPPGTDLESVEDNVCVVFRDSRTKSSGANWKVVDCDGPLGRHPVICQIPLRVEDDAKDCPVSRPRTQTVTVTETVKKRIVETVTITEAVTVTHAVTVSAPGRRGRVSSCSDIKPSPVVVNYDRILVVDMTTIYTNDTAETTRRDATITNWSTLVLMTGSTYYYDNYAHFHMDIPPLPKPTEPAEGRKRRVTSKTTTDNEDDVIHTMISTTYVPFKTMGSTRHLTMLREIYTSMDTSGHT